MNSDHRVTQDKENVKADKNCLYNEKTCQNQDEQWLNSQRMFQGRSNRGVIHNRDNEVELMSKHQAVQTKMNNGQMVE